MSRIQAGDVGAFELLYARYSHPLINFFFQMCFDRVAAEDYLQETFLRVWRARQSYRPIGKVSTWLFQIAKNYWLNEREKMKRRPFHTVVGGDDAQAQWANVASSDGETSPAAAALWASARAWRIHAMSAASRVRSTPIRWWLAACRRCRRPPGRCRRSR